MKSFKSIIVDDEELARQDLKNVLADFDQIKVIGEADCVDQARDLIAKLHPDLVFLDIHLTGESGFDLLDYLPSDIVIIFITAFDQYAIRAFEVNAQDYLLKPVSRDRLANTLDRLNQKPGSDAEIERKLNRDDSIFLKKEKGYAFVRINRILFIEAQNDYSLIHIEKDEQIIVHKPMKEWEARLPDQLFCRVHRATIVNIDRVKKIDPWYNNSYLITLDNYEKPIVMSRRYFAQIKARLG